MFLYLLQVFMFHLGHLPVSQTSYLECSWIQISISLIPTWFVLKILIQIFYNHGWICLISTYLLLLLFRRYYGLSTYDQHNISSKFLIIIQSMKEKAPAHFGVCSDIPSTHQVSLLFDLLEISGNIQGILTFIGLLVAFREHPYINSQLVEGSVVKGREPSKLLSTVSLIRKYYACVLNSAQLTGTIFRG